MTRWPVLPNPPASHLTNDPIVQSILRTLSQNWPPSHTMATKKRPRMRLLEGVMFSDKWGTGRAARGEGITAASMGAVLGVVWRKSWSYLEVVGGRFVGGCFGLLWKLFGLVRRMKQLVWRVFAAGVEDIWGMLEIFFQRLDDVYGLFRG